MGGGVLGLADRALKQAGLADRAKKRDSGAAGAGLADRAKTAPQASETTDSIVETA